MKRFLIGCITIICAASAFAQTPAPATAMAWETVSASGMGRASVTPDRFSFNVGVQTVGNTVEDAVAQNNKRVAAVLAALKAAGAQEKDIQTANFNIYPQQDYREGQQPRILGYQVSNTVTVRSTKVADAGRLLGIAIGAGVNTASGINFEVADQTRGRDQGLRAAFNDAKAKATLLAQAAGRTLGRVLTVSEGAHSAPPQPYAFQRAAAMEARADVPIESGTQEQTFTVSVTFALQ